MHTTMGAGGPACPRCGASHEGYESNEEMEVARERDEHYRPYGGAAQYGDDSYFTDAEGAALSGSASLPSPLKKKKYDPKDS